MAKQKEKKSALQESTDPLRKEPEEDLTRRGTPRKRAPKRSKAEKFIEEVKNKIEAAKAAQEHEALCTVVFREWIPPETLAIPLNIACAALKKPPLDATETESLANAAYPLGVELLDLFIHYGKYIRFGMVVGGIIIARVGKSLEPKKEESEKTEEKKEGGKTS